MTTTWQERHEAALAAPEGPERPLVALWQAVGQYAEAYEARYGSPIGKDGVLGPNWLAILDGFVGLLNGESGRLDCGSLDHEARELARRHGFSESEVDEL